MKIKLVYSLLTALIITAVTSTSCKKYADPPPYFEDDLDTSNNITSRRVLLIGIDGAVSSEVKAMAPPTITGMLAHAKFQWDGVTDEVSTDAASWKTLVSGVSYGRHKILDSTFIYTPPDGGNSHGGAPQFYPSMFSYILSSASQNNMRTSFISSWPTLIERVVPEVMDPVITSGDQGVKDSAIARIKNSNPEFMVLHFNTPSIAGKSGGFSAANPSYEEAVKKVDGYIGEIMTALKARPEYNKNEEWLVIIASTHGGVGSSYGGTSDAETQAFQMFYNEKFKPLEFTTIGAFYGTRFSGGQSGGIRAVMEDPNAYNPGTGQFTFEMKMKGTVTGSFPLFVSKKGPAVGNMLDAADPGIAYFRNGNNWSTQFRGTGGNVRLQTAMPAGGSAFNEIWHTLSLVIIDSANIRWLKRYFDGIIIDQTNINTFGAITSPRPWIIGWSQGNAGDALTANVAMNVADIRFFNTGMTSKEIADNVCLQDITKHPKFANLIGYFPASDGTGGRLKNQAPGAVNKDFILENNYQWGIVPLFPCNVPLTGVPAGKIVQLQTSGSVAKTAFYWLRIPIQDSWSFEGIDWLKNYDSEFVEF